MDAEKVWAGVCALASSLSKGKDRYDVGLYQEYLPYTMAGRRVNAILRKAGL
jgi:hypothetical protein